MTKLKIITVATESKYYFPYLQNTIKKNDGELVVLGYGKEWEGFSWKYDLMIQYLKKLNPTDIVCFVDGYDVICLRNLKELPNQFMALKKKYNCKIIVGCDHYNNSVQKVFANFYFGFCNNSPLNSGNYIGYAKDILEIILNIHSQTTSNTSDDQILMNAYCNQNKKDFYIDTKSEIFLVISDPLNEIDDLVTIRDKKLYFENSRPFFLHGNGATYLDNVLQKLGYKNVDVKTEFEDNFFKKIALLIHPNLYNYISKQNKYLSYLLLILLTILICLVFGSIGYFIYKFIRNSKFFNSYKTKKTTR